MKINHPIDPHKWNNLLYRADCKYALEHLIENKLKVDLIYLDPPFNSNRNYNIIYQVPSTKYQKNYSAKAVQKAFHDMWTMTCQTRQLVIDFQQQLDTTEELSPLVKTFLEAWIEPFLEDGKKDSAMIVYLIYMTERLILMKKVLKDTGSIYLHCDPTASHYLKVIMDGIFGRENFRNEIVWCYHGPGSPNMRQFNRKSDTIFWYSKGSKWIFNKEAVRIPFKDPNQSLRRAMSVDGTFTKDDIEKYRAKGKIPENWWVIRIAARSKKEYLGYPTQKPIALLDRIIKASCPEDGIVLDPFCGCGTTLESAITHKRKWIGIDISNNAIEVMRSRIENIVCDDTCTQYKKHEIIHGNPETFEAYEKLTPYQRQEWTINTIGGFCNPKKSNDGGVDGELTVHGGFDKEGQDIWNKVVFSVKTGKQCNPVFLRELIGTMKLHNAVYGGLILDEDPTDKMLANATSQKKIKYQYAEELPPQYFDTVQILTSQQIIDGAKFDLPPSINKIKEYRKQPTIF